MKGLSFLILGLALAPLSTPAAAEAPARVLAAFPNGTFLENLVVRDDGSVLFTSYFDRKLLVLERDGTVRTLAELPAHPVGIAPAGDGWIVSAHGRPFTDAPAFLSSNQMLRVSADGRVLAAQAAPEGRFLNGVLRIGEDSYLVADSIAGAIWRYSPSTGEIGPWLRDERLAPDPSVEPFRPGANGLKVRDGRLFVSNSSRGEITTVALGRDGAAAGPLRAYAAPGPIDDFVLARDGTLYGATHGERLLAVEPDGRVRTVMAEGCGGCTSVAFSGPDETRLVVLTTGGLSSGGRDPARVLSVPVRAAER